MTFKMKYDFTNSSTIYSIFDDSNNELITNSDTKIDEILVRRMKDMRSLFLNSDGYEDDFPLYYMYNGIYKEEHKSFFKEKNIKYEYTILPSINIHDEFMKAHGHVHAIHPIKKTRHCEVYEILQGEGIFELFKYRNESEIEVLMVNVKKGDYFVIPRNYYHLSINTSNIPFIFGDLIVDDASNDYTPLKEMDGAPVFVLKDDNNVVNYRHNKKYSDHTIDIQTASGDNLPWPEKIEKIPLYAHFIANAEYFSFLK